MGLPVGIYTIFLYLMKSVCKCITRFIEYVRNNNGIILTASEAKELYDKKTTKFGNRSCELFCIK